MHIAYLSRYREYLYFSGGFSAALTTPLDVAKTRIMLAHHDSAVAKGNINMALRIVYKQHGLSGYVLFILQ